jgi:hypothetical protein
MIELMKPKYTFTQSEIQDGDIICFQVDISDKEIHDLEAQALYSNPPQFYDFLQNRVMVLFRPKFDEPDAEQPEFNLVLSKKQNYDAVRLTSPIDLVLLGVSDILPSDGFQGRRIPQARGDKTKVHHNSRREWHA